MELYSPNTAIIAAFTLIWEINPIFLLFPNINVYSQINGIKVIIMDNSVGAGYSHHDV